MLPQDVVLALVLKESESSTVSSLAAFLSISPSQAHASMKRLETAGLCKGRVINRRGLLEFLVHGLRYVFPAALGAPAVGIPTSWAAPVFADRLLHEGPVPVWPDAEGKERGFAFEPLHFSAVFVSKQSPRLYDILSAVEALRENRPRVRGLAVDFLKGAIGANET